MALSLSSIGTPAHTLTVTSPVIPVFMGIPAFEPVRLSGAEQVNSLFACELLLRTPHAMDWTLPHTEPVLRQIEHRLREQPNARFSSLLAEVIQFQR